MVWEMRDDVLTSPQRFVLLCLANHATADGRNCYPSVRRIMRHTSLGERTVQQALGSLVRRGLTRPERTYRRATQYAINIDALQRLRRPDDSAPHAESKYDSAPHAESAAGDSAPDAPHSAPDAENSARGALHSACGAPDPSLDPSSEPSSTPTESSSEVDQFLTTFSDLRERLRGTAYSPRRGDRQAVERLLQRVHAYQEPVATLRLMAEVLMKVGPEVDAWIAESDCSIRVLEHRADWLLDRIGQAGHLQKASIWDAVRRAMAVSTWDRSTWFASCREVGRDGDVLVVSTSGVEHADYLERNYRRAIDEAARTVSPSLRVQFQPAGGAIPDVVETRARQELRYGGYGAGVAR